MSWVVGSFLAVLVAAAWIAAVGFARLRAPFDRMHCITFVNAGCGLAMLGASLAGDGFSNRTGNILLIVAVSLFGGAAGSFALGRALRLRGSVPEVD